MVAIRSAGDGRPPSGAREDEVGLSGTRSRQEREEAARAWLGGAARGGERLARIFQIGRAARASELEGARASSVLRAAQGTQPRSLSAGNRALKLFAALPNHADRPRRMGRLRAL